MSILCLSEADLIIHFFFLLFWMIYLFYPLSSFCPPFFSPGHFILSQITFFLFLGKHIFYLIRCIVKYIDGNQTKCSWSAIGTRDFYLLSSLLLFIEFFEQLITCSFFCIHAHPDCCHFPFIYLFFVSLGNGINLIILF